jgi:hypothetical protein
VQSKFQTMKGLSIITHGSLSSLVEWVKSH